MSKYLLYRCLDCNHEVVGKSNLDGRCCDKCRGPICPIREATLDEFKAYSIPPNCGSSVVRPERIEPIVKPMYMDMKLQYLDRLTALHGKMPTLQDGNKNMTTRIHAVCNSIEKDLGLNDVINANPALIDELHEYKSPFKVGDLNIKLDVDTSPMMESIKRIGEQLAAAVKEKAAVTDKPGAFPKVGD